MRRQTCWGLVAFAAALVGASLTQAAERTWNTSSTGSFNVAGNWTPSGVPGVDDRAVLRRGDDEFYSVNFPGRINIPLPVYAFDQLRIGSNTVTFADDLDLLEAPGTVIVDNTTTATAGRAIIVGENDTDDDAILNTSLAHFSGVAATIGDAPDSIGRMNVTGGTFNVTGSSATDAELIIGNQGKGTLSISGGAHVNVNGANGNVVVSRIGVPPGTFFQLETGTLFVSGAGSQLNTAGDFSVGPLGKGSVNVSGGGQLASGSATIGGASQSTVTVSGAGSTWTNAGNLTIGAGLPNTAGGGGLSVSTGGEVSVGGVLTVQPEADLNMGNATISGDVSNNGNMSVGGTLVNPVTTLVTGDFSHSGVFSINLGSRLHVEGNILLSGAQCTLKLPSLPLGTYDILDWDGTFTGTFDVLPQLPSASPLALDFSQLYVTGEVTIDYKYAADFDTDADVDFFDFLYWEGGLGATGSATHAQGDADGDHDVDGVDFLKWQQQFGSGVAAAAAGDAVPESTTRVLAAAGALLAIRRRGGLTT